MPQLNTTAWPTIIMSMLLALFLLMQLKTLNTHYHPPASPKLMNIKPHSNSWEHKWTKIYSPHSLPLQS
nr:ATP synthase F0 subunit 8 [Hoolock hoolock]UOG85203.1 ATP synthase F0 subunit 8 [Hoolock hoolock]UOG85216.1 ATP synthase F0 subunit 8 [Hoolock hoolock]UOG85229.1 ATP synthase F0 subunit 8 [Hoolock hoolock]UOG85242.1 ATP synthase F0 subunit 8 [Hoolock hoolock]